MMNFFRVFLAAFAVTLVAASVALFLDTERRLKTLNSTKANAEAGFSSWERQNNCFADPLSCAEYSEQYKGWFAQLEQYIDRKMQKPEYKFYQFLKNTDEQYVSDLNLGGLASLGAAGILLLLLIFSIVYLLGGKKKNKESSLDFKRDKPTKKIEPIRLNSAKKDPVKTQPVARVQAQTQTIKTEAVKTESIKTEIIKLESAESVKSDANTMLRKATDCADSEPMQAISYLEQALEGSLSTKLSMLALLLCGSLRLKNSIGEDRGHEQLQEIMAASPQSPEAEKAQIVLDAFK
ncbi:MAG: hypothetical protein FWB90_01790 [Fibromonadales bacterium]|nr:hypothetical protein [Fibromonadales bacterium]